MDFGSRCFPPPGPIIVEMWGLINAEITQLHSALVCSHSELCDPLWLSFSCGWDSELAATGEQIFPGRWGWGCVREIAIRENDGASPKGGIQTNGRKSSEGFGPGLSWTLSPPPHGQHLPEVVASITSGRGTTDGFISLGRMLWRDVSYRMELHHL